MKTIWNVRFLKKTRQGTMRFRSAIIAFLLLKRINSPVVDAYGTYYIGEKKDTQNTHGFDHNKHGQEV